MAPRADGRSVSEMRSLTGIFERLDRVDGSASFGFGETKALASVSGPIEVRLAVEQPSKATFEVTLRPLSGIPGTESKSLSASLRSVLAPSLILTRNPRTLVQLVFQSLTPSHSTHSPFYPSLVASFINASTLALLSVGSVPMSGVVCAVAVARIRSSDLNTSQPAPTLTLVLDPTEDESLASEGGGCFAFIFASDPADAGTGVVAKLVWTDWKAAKGTFDEGELSRATQLAKVGAERVREKMKDSVRSLDGSSDTSTTLKAEDNQKEAMEVEEDVDDAKMEI
ncbi:hypothetical protein BV25DRAFT_810414 [Artomyces pyxidatus]|uniref:Uncharacterized protein n=1 Tax=Artomyces pyxidatus TaxID=48021 RepID=A0ACB8SEF8_9AGAM|nr:hypothetical protein BV25DRAFT_810414 [Artomyces pyxidatus]